MSSPIRFGERLHHARQNHPEKPSLARLESLVQKAGGSIKAARLNRLELGYADPTRAEISVLAVALGLGAGEMGADGGAASVPDDRPPSPEVLGWRLPARTNTQDSYTYRSILIAELARLRAWLKQPGLSRADATSLEGFRTQVDAAIAQSRVRPPPVVDD